MNCIIDSSLSEERLTLLASLYELNITALLSWLETLVYGVFALTFAFYLALFTKNVMKSEIVRIRNKNNYQFIIGQWVVFAGNMLWAYLALSISWKIEELSICYEYAFAGSMAHVLGGVDGFEQDECRSESDDGPEVSCSLLAA